MIDVHAQCVTYTTRIADVVGGDVETAPHVSFVVSRKQHAVSVSIQLLTDRKFERRSVSLTPSSRVQVSFKRRDFTLFRFLFGARKIQVLFESFFLY